MYYIGVDVGSVSTDVVIIDSFKRILASGIKPSGSCGKDTASALVEELFISMGKPFRESPSFVVSTGYGRKNVENMDKAITEITCHAVGAKHLFPETDTVLDIGGQDSKAIKLDKNGMVSDFQMNDRCAAGTGRFVEVMASVLETDLAELNGLYFEPGEAVNMSATCTVFAESEIISLLNDGVSKSRITKGLFRSIAERSIQLLSIINPGSNLTLTGGVPKNRALVEEIRLSFKGNLNIPPDPQSVGALGAALLAHKHSSKK
jgi:predicted CoA-substrate-specific enzyme activase